MLMDPPNLDRRLLRFSGIFVLIYAAFEIIYLMIPDPVLAGIIYPAVYTGWCEWLINLLAFEEVTGTANLLSSSIVRLEIVRGCDGAGATFLLCAALLSSPAGLKNKAIGLFIGIGFVYILNLSRIVVLYFIAAYRDDWFLPIHTLIAPTFIILLCCLYFTWWINRFGKPNASPA